VQNYPSEEATASLSKASFLQHLHCCNARGRNNSAQHSSMLTPRAAAPGLGPCHPYWLTFHFKAVGLFQKSALPTLSLQCCLTSAAREKWVLRSYLRNPPDRNLIRHSFWQNRPANSSEAPHCSPSLPDFLSFLLFLTIALALLIPFHAQGLLFPNSSFIRLAYFPQSFKITPAPQTLPHSHASFTSEILAFIKMQLQLHPRIFTHGE